MLRVWKGRWSSKHCKLVHTRVIKKHASYLHMQATRLNAEELIKLEALLAGCVNAADYRASDNAVLRTVGKVCMEMQHVPVLKLSDGSLC